MFQLLGTSYITQGSKSLYLSVCLSISRQTSLMDYMIKKTSYIKENKGHHKIENQDINCNNHNKTESNAGGLYTEFLLADEERSIWKYGQNEEPAIGCRGDAPGLPGVGRHSASLTKTWSWMPPPPVTLTMSKWPTMSKDEAKQCELLDLFCRLIWQYLSLCKQVRCGGSHTQRGNGGKESRVQDQLWLPSEF